MTARRVRAKRDSRVTFGPATGLATAVAFAAVVSVAGDTVHAVTCPDSAPAARGRLVVKHLGPPTGDEEISLQADFTLPAAPTFDPLSSDFQIVIEDLGAGGAAVFDLSDQTHPVPPGGAGSGCDATRDGWSAHRSGGMRVYRNVSDAIDPPLCTPASANGLRVVSLRSRRPATQQTTVRLRTKHSVVAPIIGPLRATIVLGGAGCGSLLFPLADCRTDLARTKLSCRSRDGAVSPACGDGGLDEGEACDDGNSFGGDGCATNCTLEQVRSATLDPASSQTVIELSAFPVAVGLTGTSTVITGASRDGEIRNPSGEIVSNPGEIPVVLTADELRIAPAAVTGLVCLCLRGVETPAFGPGNMGAGFLGCGPNGFERPVDYRLVQDHNTTPGSPGNGGGEQLADDPECNDRVVGPSGEVSTACREGTGAECRRPQSIHPGVCNSPRVLEVAGGTAARGAGVIDSRVSVSILQDGGVCASRRFPNGSCWFQDYGPDCLPCTDDDADIAAPQELILTTGMASAAVIDALNSPGLTLEAAAAGTAFDCEALEADADRFGGGALAGARPSLDARTIGDNVQTVVLGFE